MQLEKAIFERRTIRRFRQEEIPLELMKKIVDHARIAPMGNNIQYLEYAIVLSDDLREKIFPCTAWAGSLPKKERIPEEGRRPMGYIVVLTNRNIRKQTGHEIGAAVQNMLLIAYQEGLGACWMGSINRDEIRIILDIPNEYDIEYVISLGFPDEESVIEPFKGSSKYWKDDNQKMHVPKKSLDEVIFKIYSKNKT